MKQQNLRILYLIGTLVLVPLSLWAVPISITQVSDLDFGSSAAGDIEKVVLPNTMETQENASFLITGDPNTAYSISLPTKSIQLSGPGGGRKIKVSNFTSFPLDGANGLLDSSGQQMLYVGATRESLPQNQNPGAYTGAFTITVIY